MARAEPNGREAEEQMADTTNYSEDSNETGTPPATIGQDLRAAREGAGLDLEAISRALKIRIDHLMAVEDGNVAALPGRPYAIGFVRSYASYIGLDPVQSVERFKTEMYGRRDPTQVQLAYPTGEGRLPQSAVIVLILLMILAVGYGGYYLLVSANRMADPPVTAVPERLAPEPPAPAAPPPAPLPEAPPEAPPPEVPAEQTPPQGGAPTGDATEAIPPADAPPAVAPAPAPEARAYGTGNTDSRVILRARQAAKLLVEGADGTVYINRTLAPGDLYQAPNLVGLRVSTSNPGAVEVILDGMLLGNLGRAGAPAERLSLNPQDLVDRAVRAGAG
jgi:cytoskeleton protein RodZ